MNPIITAFAQSPDRGRGLARDMRVRWAFEEIGQPYDVRLLSFAEMTEPTHRARHPFGQIPTLESGDLVLFESGAIVFHLAERHAGLLPTEPDARARAVAWMFAALSTVEPPIVDRTIVTLVEGEKSWSRERLVIVEQRIHDRLKQLSTYLDKAEWLDGDFTAGDLLMVSVLLRVKDSGLLDGYTNLAEYLARGEQRPAYKRAFAAQLAVFTHGQPND